ncbi:MAG: response regulator transcription factor [Bacteriovoracaceae bacterium]|jgi:DNA-binding response OmpR family regulator
MRLAVFDDEQENILTFKQDFSQDFNLVFEESSLNYEDVLKQGPFDAIVIDIHMPYLDGFKLFEKIQSHSSYNGCPLIYCTSDRTDSTNLDALKMGAADVINRFWSKEIIKERIIQQITKSNKKNILELRGLKLNLEEMRVELNGIHQELTLTQFKILKTVLKSYPHSVPTEQLVKAVWDNEQQSAIKSLATHLSNLRSRLPGWKFHVCSKENFILLKESRGKTVD